MKAFNRSAQLCPTDDKIEVHKAWKRVLNHCFYSFLSQAPGENSNDAIRPSIACSECQCIIEEILQNITRVPYLHNVIVVCVKEFVRDKAFSFNGIGDYMPVMTDFVALFNSVKEIFCQIPSFFPGINQAFVSNHLPNFAYTLNRLFVEDFIELMLFQLHEAVDRATAFCRATRSKEQCLYVLTQCREVAICMAQLDYSDKRFCWDNFMFHSAQRCHDDFVTRLIAGGSLNVSLVKGQMGKEVEFSEKYLDFWITGGLDRLENEYTDELLYQRVFESKEFSEKQSQCE